MNVMEATKIASEAEKKVKLEALKAEKAQKAATKAQSAPTPLILDKEVVNEEPVVTAPQAQETLPVANQRVYIGPPTKKAIATVQQMAAEGATREEMSAAIGRPLTSVDKILARGNAPRDTWLPPAPKNTITHNFIVGEDRIITFILPKDATAKEMRKAERLFAVLLMEEV